MTRAIPPTHRALSLRGSGCSNGSVVALDGASVSNVTFEIRLRRETHLIVRAPSRSTAERTLVAGHRTADTTAEHLPVCQRRPPSLRFYSPLSLRQCVHRAVPLPSLSLARPLARSPARSTRASIVSSRAGACVCIRSFDVSLTALCIYSLPLR